MKFTEIALIATIALAGSSPSFAGMLYEEMPNRYFDELSAKLISNGYRNVRVVDESAFLLSADDDSGTQVLLTAHPTNRQILRTQAIHHSSR